MFDYAFEGFWRDVAEQLETPPTVTDGTP